MNRDDMIQLIKCYNINCQYEIKQKRRLRNEWYANSIKNFNDYINKKINKNDFINIIFKMDSDYLNSIENISLYKCEIDNTTNLIQRKINYKKYYNR